MNHTFDREERRKQKEYLKTIYSDYDAKRHDVFVKRYNIETDNKMIQQYMKNRGIIE
jgi:hypothetical protein